MPSSAEHKEKAERNRLCLRILSGASGVPEWQAVVAFYSALHLVERLSACESKHSSNHQERLDYLKKHKKHRVIYTDFSTLYDASLLARYGTVNKFDKAYPGDTVEKILIDRHLVAIENHVGSHFFPPQPPPSSVLAAGS